MKGIIVLWAGAIVDIPAGWQLCNGTNGTPDLRNKFVVGAGDTYAVDASGGALTHTHDFTGDSHQHGLWAGPGLKAGFDFDSTVQASPAIGTTDADGALPPYYALAYIQKL